MLRKIRTRSIVRPCLALLCATGVAFAQETPPPAPPPPQAAELSTLQAAIEKQARQIEALTQEIAELKTILTRTHGATGATATPRAEPASPVPASPPAATASVESAPKAEAVNPATEGTKHTVAKGETLTSIAKRYNIPLAELEKFNQIQDDRKLQIGQVLKIPSTAAKTPEPPNQPKENP